MVGTPSISLVEVARSFSYKLNCGNYESRDFFCSQKAECKAEDVESTSEALHKFCKEQVLKAVRSYVAESGGKQENVR
jgi:hypothetical protein